MQAQGTGTGGGIMVWQVSGNGRQAWQWQVEMVAEQEGNNGIQAWMVVIRQAGGWWQQEWGGMVVVVVVVWWHDACLETMR